ncbi:MAG: LPS export ABC transporter permease LptF [Gammaproteobacteria bacterium]
MKKLSKYISLEVLAPFVIISFILAGLFSSFNMARYLAEAVTESLGMVLILKLILLKTVIAMEVLLPIALFAAIIVALGRLHRDQEIIVLRSAGISENLVVKNIFAVALPLGLMVGMLSIFARPWAYETIYLMDQSASTDIDIERYQAGRFYGNEENGQIIYINNKPRGGNHVEGVFHYLIGDDVSEIIIAREGYQQQAGDFRPPQLHLLDGYMYKLGHSSSADSVIEFSRFVYTPNPEIALDYQRKAASTLELASSNDPRDIAEFQWRLSRFFATVLLALLAIPLSRASPRQGKSEKIIAAAIIFAIYYNLSSLAQTWVEQGIVGKMPGVWWLHVLMFLIVVSVLFPSSLRKIFLRA